MGSFKFEYFFHNLPKIAEFLSVLVDCNEKYNHEIKTEKKEKHM